MGLAANTMVKWDQVREEVCSVCATLSHPCTSKGPPPCREWGSKGAKTQNWARVMWWIPVRQFTATTYLHVGLMRCWDSGDLDSERYVEEMQEGTVGDSSRNLSGKEYIACGRLGRKDWWSFTLGHLLGVWLQWKRMVGTSQSTLLPYS